MQQKCATPSTSTRAPRPVGSNTYMYPCRRPPSGPRGPISQTVPGGGDGCGIEPTPRQHYLPYPPPLPQQAPPVPDVRPRAMGGTRTVPDLRPRCRGPVPSRPALFPAGPGRALQARPLSARAPGQACAEAMAGMKRRGAGPAGAACGLTRSDPRPTPAPRSTVIYSLQSAAAQRRAAPSAGTSLASSSAEILGPAPVLTAAIRGHMSAPRHVTKLRRRRG